MIKRLIQTRRCLPFGFSILFEYASRSALLAGEGRGYILDGQNDWQNPGAPAPGTTPPPAGPTTPGGGAPMPGTGTPPPAEPTTPGGAPMPGGTPAPEPETPGGGTPPPPAGGGMGQEDNSGTGGMGGGTV